MQRFNTGDHVVILPQFARPYRRHSGVIVAVKLDPFRTIFNEYTLEFSDKSIAHLFEFQLIEDKNKYQIFMAAVVFDSRHQVGMRHFRGQGRDRRIVLQTLTIDIDIDMKIRLSQTPISIIGQVWEQAVGSSMGPAEVTLMKHNTPINTTTTDSFGTFLFSSVNPGAVNIEVLMPANYVRILGSFSI